MSVTDEATREVASGTARYELVETIASGGMARVYLGRMRVGPDDSSPAPVAVKILHPHLAQDPGAVALFLDEARVATRIRHPNVVEVRDVDMVGEDLVIIMEYIEGIALSSMIRTLREAGSSIPLPVVVRVLVDALRGLHAAHELEDEHGEAMRIVHRDVSPHNVLVGADGVARVADFGVATSVGRLAQTRTGDGVRGKLQYLAPEQIQRKTPDRRVDVWAAGLVLWECLTGKRLFDGGTEAETIADTLKAPIAPPSTLRHDATFELDEICLRALERDPARRYPTAAAFADALERESGLVTAGREDVAALVYRLEGAALLERRQAFERGTKTAAARPSRAPPARPPEPEASTRTAPASVAPAAQAPRPSIPAAPAKPRSNALALVVVATISLVVGGLGVRFAGSERASPPAPSVSPTTAASPFPADAGVASAAAASASAVSSEPAVTGSPAPTPRPSGKKRPAPRPAAPSSSERPFVPAEL
jgi:serine/threonine-protein kinase